jgi:tetratricopeptide (TPR) repeat protein
VHELASALGVRGFSTRAAQRLHAHTGGNALYVKTMLSELPEKRWRTWNPSLPAPRAFTSQVLRRLEAASPPTRGLVEAVAVLGTTAPVGAAATLAGVPDLFAALDEASVAGLLQVREDFGIREVGFPHPLVQAAVYEQLGPLRRMQLHSAAAEFVEDEGALLRHRVLAATPPNTELAAELEAFARREAAVGAWASAAWALVEGSNLSPNREAREKRLLLAVDATVGAGDLHQAEIFARDVASFSRGAWRDAALGYLAILRGRRDEAEELLGHAWRLSADDPDTSVAAVVAQRWGLHAVGRLRGDEVVRWSTRAIELARPGDPVRVEAEALLGLGMGWQGQIAEGMTAYEELLGRVNAAADGPQLERIRMAHGWLRMVGGDVAGARASLAMTAPAALRAGSVRIAVWAFSWLAYAEFVLGAWDEAAADAERAVSLLDESGMEWLRPLARYAAVLVPAARGRWAEAEEHLRAGAAQTGDYELMVVASRAGARGGGGGARRAGGRAARHAARVGHPAAGRGRRAGLLAVAGRLRRGADQRGQAGRGRGAPRPARRAGGRARASGHDGPPVPGARAAGGGAREPAACGGGLPARARRPGRAAHAVRAGAGGAGLRAGPAPRWPTPGRGHAAAGRPGVGSRTCRPPRSWSAASGSCAGAGSRPPSAATSTRASSPRRSRPWARLVAVGMSNRQVAAELFVSIKTVQFHLTHIYAKLGISSRAELAAQFRE